MATDSINPLDGLPGDPAKAQIIQAASEMTGVEESRATAESQAGFVVAKRFPREQSLSLNRIVQSCQRKSLAEQAEYAFPRGGSMVTGPSIRLAEVLAQSWGNLLFGVRELQEIEGASLMMAYCYDLETNLRAERVFTVKHQRKARGKIERLTDPRDIYEMNFNQAARRLRACILQVIPGDVVELAVEACRATLEATDADASKENVAKMVKAFAELGVTEEMIQKRIGKKISAISPPEMVSLRKVFTSIRDGMSKVDQWFETEPESAADLKEKLKGMSEKSEQKKRKTKKKAKPAPEPEEEAPEEPIKGSPEPQEPAEAPAAPVEPSEEPEPSEGEEMVEAVIPADLSASTLEKPAKPSQWNAQYDGLRERAIDAGITVFDWHEAVTQILGQIGCENVNDLAVTKRPTLKAALVAFVEQLEEQNEVE